jgi:hypothetical protein
MLHPPPKGVVQNSSFNPNACAAQNYNIIEHLVQTPSAILALEVLQSFPT